jgi:hypothetical protein
MSFLYPFYLWALAGISLPLLIHLFGKKKGKTINFPTLRFLKLAQSKTGRIRKLEEILILLLRALLLTLLLITLAGPVLKNIPLFLEEQLIVFIIDDSFSMNSTENGKSSFDTLKDLAIETIGFIKKPAMVSLVYLSGRYEPFSHNYPELKEIIRKSSPSYQKGRLAFAVNKAVENLEVYKKKDEKIVFFFTDMQNRLWEDFPENSFKKKDVRFFIFDTGCENTKNLSFKNLYIIPGKNTAVSEIKNWGKDKTDGEVTVYGDGWESSQIKSMEGNSESIFIFNVPEETGKIYGKINNNDALSTDNHFYFSFKTTDDIKKILLVSEDEKSSFYVKKAIRAVLEQDKTELIHKKPSELETLFFKDYQSVFMVNSGRTQKESVQNIYSYLKEGGSLIYFPGERVTDTSFNSDWQIKEEDIFLMPGKIEGEITELKDELKVGYVETSHPVFVQFRETVFEYMQKVTFKQLFTIENISGTVLLETSEGIPLLVEKKIGKGSVFFFTFLTDEKWTNLHKKPFFPVLIKSLLNCSTGQESKSAVAGEKITMPIPDDAENVFFYPPDGEKKIPVISSPNIEFFVDAPGFWKTEINYRNGKVEKLFSVNVDWEEGNLRKADTGEIKRKIPGINVEIVKGGEARKFLAQKGKTSELLYGFLNIVFFLFLIEVTVSNFLYHKKAGNDSK